MHSIDRRRFLTATSACGLGLAAIPLLPGRAWSQMTDSDGMGGTLMTPATRAAIDRGLSFLARQQSSDGSFRGGAYNRNAAIVSLAGMAFMSCGSTPGRGPYGVEVRRCVDFIMSLAKPSGFIVSPAASQSHGPMYEHGFATMFLAEAYGMSLRTDIREALVKAVRRIRDTQNAEGGWRYKMERGDADISVTVAQVMALRAARNAGIPVSHTKTIKPAVEYIKSCQNPDGGFMYRSHGGPSDFPRSAAAIVALYSAGIYDGEEIQKGLGYLLEHMPETGSSSQRSHFYYGHYYAVQAMWHADNPYWQKWYPAIREVLLTRQTGDEGAWVDDMSPEYATAMACLVLQMPNNYLPIFQK